MEDTTVTFDIEDKDDARKMCEILAMNGYTVKAEADNHRFRYLISVNFVEETDWFTNLVEKIKNGMITSDKMETK